VEPNPYESPKADGPVTAAQVVKRGIRAVTIVLLMPFAVVVAGFVKWTPEAGQAAGAF
jgi:hypothetical protein